MKKILFALFVCLVPAFAFAQPIHNQPQKAFYASPAEWPLNNGQAHGRQVRDVPLPLNSVNLAHIHIECYGPTLAELNAPVTLPCTLVLHKVDGRISNGRNGDPRTIVNGRLVTDVQWDATGTSIPPDLVGDPNGVVTYGLKVTVDPTLRVIPGGYDPPPLHGYYGFQINARVFFANGHTLNDQLLIPYYSMLDPSAPELSFVGDGLGKLAASAFPEAEHPAGPDAFGASISEIMLDYALPIFAPINSSWTVHLFLASYGIIPGGSCGTAFEARLDPDPHHGVEGTLLKRRIGGIGIEDFFIIDPAVIGVGTHKIAFDWIVNGDCRPDLFSTGEVLVSRLVITLTVVPPSTPAVQQPPPFAPPPPSPPTCQDPTATNLGGPLPCVFPPPPPPPPPIITTIYTFTCDAAGNCRLVKQ